MTAAGSSIHKVGRNKDVNRDTAKWSHDVERTLKVMGGPALVNQLKQECKKPEEMPQTRLSAHLPAYQTDVDEGFKLPPEAEAGGSSDYDKQKLSDLHMAVQQANATVESTRTLRPQGKKPEVRHDGPLSVRGRHRVDARPRGAAPRAARAHLRVPRRGHRKAGCHS